MELHYDHLLVLPVLLRVWIVNVIIARYTQIIINIINIAAAAAAAVDSSGVPSYADSTIKGDDRR